MTEYGSDGRPGKTSGGPENGLEAADGAFNEKLARIVSIFHLRFAKKIVPEFEETKGMSGASWRKGSGFFRGLVKEVECASSSTAWGYGAY